MGKEFGAVEAFFHLPYEGVMRPFSSPPGDHIGEGVRGFFSRFLRVFLHTHLRLYLHSAKRGGQKQTRA